MENLVAVFVVDFEFVFVDVGCAVCVAQLAQTDKIVGESGYDMSCSCVARGDTRYGERSRPH